MTPNTTQARNIMDQVVYAKKTSLSNPPCAGRYKCVVIDPPWDQGKTGKRAVRPNQGTDLSYPTMTYSEIASLPIKSL